MRINYLTYLFFLVGVIQFSCQRADTVEYIKWYNAVKPYSLHIREYEVEVKEYPMELAWISFYGSRLNQSLLDSIRREKPEIIHLRVTVKSLISPEEQMANPGRKFHMESLKFGVDGKRILDVTNENPVSSHKSGTYLLTILSKEIKSDSELDIVDISANKHHKIKLDEILLTDKKKLKI